MLQTQSELPRFNTEWVVARLKQGGWNEEQAVALRDVFREGTRGLSSVAETKKLEEKIEGLRLLMISGLTIMGLGFAMLGFLIGFKEFLFLE